MYRRYTRLIKTNISVFRIRNDLLLDRIISSYIYWLRKKFCQLDFHLTLRAKWQLQVFNFHLATKFSEVAAFLMWLDIQPFHATNDLFLHPLQTPGNQRLDIQPCYYWSLSGLLANTRKSEIRYSTIPCYYWSLSTPPWKHQEIRDFCFQGL